MIRYILVAAIAICAHSNGAMAQQSPSAAPTAPASTVAKEIAALEARVAQINKKLNRTAGSDRRQLRWERRSPTNAPYTTEVVSTPSVIAYGGTTQSVSAMRDYLTPHSIPASERASLLSERQEAEAKLAALRELAEN